MQITVLAFASAREALGTARLELELPDGATVADALAALDEGAGALRAFGAGLRVAVNEEIVMSSTPLAAGATLALLPPMSGG